jgi:hypothetical protein
MFFNVLFEFEVVFILKVDIKVLMFFFLILNGCPGDFYKRAFFSRTGLSTGYILCFFFDVLFEVIFILKVDIKALMFLFLILNGCRGNFCKRAFFSRTGLSTRYILYFVFLFFIKGLNGIFAILGLMFFFRS